MHMLAIFRSRMNEKVDVAALKRTGTIDPNWKQRPWKFNNGYLYELVPQNI